MAEPPTPGDFAVAASRASAWPSRARRSVSEAVAGPSIATCDGVQRNLAKHRRAHRLRHRVDRPRLRAGHSRPRQPLRTARHRGGLGSAALRGAEGGLDYRLDCGIVPRLMRSSAFCQRTTPPRFTSRDSKAAGVAGTLGEATGPPRPTRAPSRPQTPGPAAGRRSHAARRLL